MLYRLQIIKKVLFQKQRKRGKHGNIYFTKLNFTFKLLYVKCMYAILCKVK